MARKTKGSGGYKKQIFEPNACFDCEHVTKHNQFENTMKLGKGAKARVQRRCTKHNIWVGESSKTCADGTNVIPMFPPVPKWQKEEQVRRPAMYTPKTPEQARQLQQHRPMRGPADF